MITRFLNSCLLILMLISGVCVADENSFAKWSRIEVTFEGPLSKGMANPNPFSIRLDVLFTGPDGSTFKVPGFYEGDNVGGLNGSTWKVRFSAGQIGRWKYETTSDHPKLNGFKGVFVVTDVPDNAEGFWKWGRLEAVGTAANKIRYLKFRDGPYWLKAGCDDPENFLGGYRNYQSLVKRKAAIDYLADRGINSSYIMTHNIGGDDNDVWPWIGKSAAEAKSNASQNARFDLVKLEEWRQLFEYMQSKGVVPYLILEDDSAWKSYGHQRYYREIIARFGYLPALTFNCGEEANENYQLKESIQLMSLLQKLDPYDHPRGIHNVNSPNEDYVLAESIDFTAIQTGQPGTRKGLQHAIEHNQITREWISFCEKHKRRILVVNFDEGRPEHDRRAWWSAYLAGGVWEAHVKKPYDRPMAAWETIWKELGGARKFMESIPFWEMYPKNELVVEGQAFCLAKPDDVYAFYLPQGGKIKVRLSENTHYEAAWWNPSNGWQDKLQETFDCAGGLQKFEAPADGDWALRVVAKKTTSGLSVENGWYVHGNRAIWGYIQHNGWWRNGQRPNLTRNAPNQVGPNRTEDLDRLTDAMLQFAYPGFEHNFGLWYDRRRDKHDLVRRADNKVEPPFLEQPWARSGKGNAWDGLSQYDLTKFNEFYFRRLKAFADLCDQKGTVLFHNHYMQHALLETDAHYVDFPWRPVNCVQKTGMPDRVPAANDFYDVTLPARRELHVAYIRKCLDVLGSNRNVVFLCSEEYTGPASFMRFWIDTIREWQTETGKVVHIGLSATKDVMDEVLQEPRYSKLISTVDLRYWWYTPEGKLFSPQGGKQVAGRFTSEIKKTTPEQIHRQVLEYRRKYPGNAIIHGNAETRQHAWAAMTAGASMLVGQLPYPGKSDPSDYVSPALCQEIQATYDFVRTHLAGSLQKMTPLDQMIDSDDVVWCLANQGNEYLIYAIRGGEYKLDLSGSSGPFQAQWFDPRSGKLTPEGTGHMQGGRIVKLKSPDQHDWCLWLKRLSR